jgi:hypothetical protein
MKNQIKSFFLNNSISRHSHLIGFKFIRIVKKYKYEIDKNDDAKFKISQEELISNDGQKNTGWNSKNNNSHSINKKRSRLSFLRDGMIITFYLRTV